MNPLDELRSSIRLRVGLAAILAIVGLYALLEWRDHVAASTLDYRRLLTQVARLGQGQHADKWPDRAREANAALADLQGQLWRDESTGLAQAQVQDWVGALIRKTDAKAATVRVSEPDAGLDGAAFTARLPVTQGKLLPLRARVEFNSDAAVLLTLLAAMNDANHRVTVTSMTVKPLRTDLTLTFWFEIGSKASP